MDQKNAHRKRHRPTGRRVTAALCQVRPSNYPYAIPIVAIYSGSAVVAILWAQSSELAHREGRHLERQPSLSGHCGHGAIFGVQRSVANDPERSFAEVPSCKRGKAQLFGPGSLFDHLVGEREHFGGDRDANRLGGNQTVGEIAAAPAAR